MSLNQIRGIASRVPAAFYELNELVGALEAVDQRLASYHAGEVREENHASCWSNARSVAMKATFSIWKLLAKSLGTCLSEIPTPGGILKIQAYEVDQDILFLVGRDALNCEILQVLTAENNLQCIGIPRGKIGMDDVDCSSRRSCSS
jgi:hypothetical protein